MMQGMMGGGAPAGEAQKSEAAAATAIPPGSKFAKYEKLVKRKQKDNANVVFVGGLRKSTTEDRVCAHFAKFGQVESVDIKRLPDGTSRGFAFVKFAAVETVEKVLEAHSKHMIDNKWVAVRQREAMQIEQRQPQLQRPVEEEPLNDIGPEKSQ